MMRTIRVSFLLLLLCIVPTAFAQGKPNVLLIFLDNFGWGEPGFNGGGIIRGAATPTLDQLEEHVVSLKKNPPIPTGALDPYKPPQ